LSREFGAAKPDPRIIEIGLLGAGAKPMETSLIDDTPTHVSAAENLGITGHVLTNHDKLRSFLRSQGAMLAESGQKGT
jgi:putative hydrolase of the HAD superfamily